MKRKRLKGNAGLKLRVKHVFTPDSDRRLSRAIDILLRSAGRQAALPREGISAKKEEPPFQDLGENTPASGESRND